MRQKNVEGFGEKFKVDGMKTNEDAENKTAKRFNILMHFEICKVKEEMLQEDTQKVTNIDIYRVQTNTIQG